MPSLAWAAAAVAGVFLMGAVGTGASWTDAATMPGVTVRTARVAAPAVTCNLPDVSWSPVPRATGYTVEVAGLLELDLGPDAVAATLGAVAGVLHPLVTVTVHVGSWSATGSVTCS